MERAALETGVVGYRHWAPSIQCREDRAELHAFDGDHFDVYWGAVRQEIAAAQIAFLRNHLHVS